MAIEPDLEEGPRPTASERFDPTAEEDAYWTGFSLRLCAEPAAEPPAHLGPLHRADFLLGQLAGLIARFRREDADLEEDAMRIERLEGAFGEPDHHPSELVEAVGCIAARMGAS